MSPESDEQIGILLPFLLPRNSFVGFLEISHDADSVEQPIVPGSFRIHTVLYPSLKTLIQVFLETLSFGRKERPLILG